MKSIEARLESYWRSELTEKFIIGRNDCDKGPNSFPKTLQKSASP